jgi:hypothetical protein
VVFFISAAVLGAFIYDAYGSQTLTIEGARTHYADFKKSDFFAAKANSFITLRQNSLMKFKDEILVEIDLMKFRSQPSAANFVLALALNKDRQILLKKEIPYDVKSFAEDGAVNIVKIAFETPENTKEIRINFITNPTENEAFLKVEKVNAFKANFVGVFSAAFALLISLLSLIALIIARIRSNLDLMNNLRVFFYHEKRAGIFYKSAILLFIAIVIYLIIISIGFTYDQESRFLSAIAENRLFLYHSLFEYADTGRFFPLANTDFNLLYLLPFGFSANGFYFINLLSFIITILSAIYLISSSDRDAIKSKYINIFTLFFLLLATPCCVKIFLEIIYPERLLTMILILYFICYKKAIESDKTIWFILAGFFAAYSTYQKELVFGLFLAASIFSFIFMRRTNKHNIFNIFLALNAAIFLAIYYKFIFLQASGFYKLGYNLPAPKEYLLFFAKNNIFVLPLILIFIRAYFLLFKRDRGHLFFDLLLFVAVTFISAHIALGLTAKNQIIYYAPIVFILAPVIAHWAKYLYFSERKALFWLLLFIVAINARGFSLENEIIFKRQCADFAARVTGYARLNKPLVIVAEKEELSPRAADFVAYMKYAASEAYLLNRRGAMLEANITTPSEQVDKSAIYVFVSDSRNPDFRKDKKFACFRDIGLVVSPAATYTAAVCEEATSR